MNNNNQKRYLLPFIKRSKMKLKVYILFIFMIVVFGGLAFIPVGEGIQFYLYKIFSLGFSAFCLYAWLFTGVFRKMRLKLTDDCLEFRTPFGEKQAKWDEINDVKIFNQGYNTFIGIILEEKIKKMKQNKSFWYQLRNLLGDIFSIKIPLSSFKDVDPERLYLTIRTQIKEHENKIEYNENNTNKEKEKKKDSSQLEAFFKVLILVIIVGIGYGFSIYFFGVNIILIPFIGYLGIIYIYHNNVDEKDINWFNRLLIGLFSAAQIIIALITGLMLNLNVPLSISNVVQITIGFLQYMLNNPFEQLMVWVIVLLLFSAGMFHGKSYRITRMLRKIVMKRKGKYYVKKKNQKLRVYLKDPADFIEEEEKFTAQINEGCFVKKRSKDIGALFLSKELEVVTIQV